MATLTVLDPWFKFTATQDGRDKIYRFLQYYARVIEANSDGETAAKWGKLSGALGTARKLFRAGKFLNNLDAMLTAFKNPSTDSFTRVSQVGRNAFLGLWLLQDMIQWFHSIGFIKVADIKTMNKRVAQCWLISLCFSIALILHNLRKNAASLQKARGDQAATNTLVLARHGLFIDLGRDLLDLFLPGSLLEYVNPGPTFVGVVGATTSLIQAWQLWPAPVKK